jgi:hypothetical protein
MAGLAPKIGRAYLPRSAKRRPRKTAAWLTLAGLVFQLFTTQVHGFMGPLGWSEPGPSSAVDQAYAQALAADALCLAPTAEGRADGRSDQGLPHRDECPIFQSLAVVGVSLPAAAIVLPLPPPPEAQPALRLAADIAVPDPPHSRHRSRAPPLPA